MTRPAGEPAFRYRRDIDGLRAWAVVAVIVFHMDPMWLPGGFTGVDVFFVISGYLITSILHKDLQAGRFSFRDFYLRRIRRIAPAYFLVTASTLCAGSLLLASEDLRSLCRSALWSAVALPNVYFWLHLDAGYFAADVRQVPLLHLWSLGVEEQFYLLWPALLLASWRLSGGRATVPALSLLTIASFALAEMTADAAPKFAYYMLPARAGELGVGALLALLPGRAAAPSRAGSFYELVAAGGVGLIAFGMATLDGDARFPGLNALYPTLGTALLILAGSRRPCWVAAPLRWRPIAWLGLLSYSLYLWHWPLLAMVRYFDPDPPNRTLAYAAALTLLLSMASYYLVERPVRASRIGPRRQALYWYAAPATLLVVAAMAISANVRHLTSFNQDSRLAALEQQRKADTAAAFEFDYNCQIGSADPRALVRPECHFGSKTTGHQALLWGDSHASHYVGAIAELAKRRNFGVRNISYSTCPPILGGSRDYGTGEYRAGCGPFRAMVGASMDDYDIVLLGGLWSVYADIPGFMQDLETTLDTLLSRGKTVVLLAQVPQFPRYDRNCEIRNVRHQIIDCRAMSVRADTGITTVNRKLRALAASRPGASYFDLHEVFCRQGTCSPYLDGHAVYFDTTHLSMAGSWRVGAHAIEAGIEPAAFTTQASIDAGSRGR